METMNGIQVKTRWMNQGDLSIVLGIEESCFSNPWAKPDFKEALAARNTNCIVLESLNTRTKYVVGFAIYQLTQRGILLLNIAIEPIYHRNRYGTFLINDIKRNLTPQGRKKIETEVRETNLTAQLFFRANGFLCYDQLEDFFDPPETAYCFRYRI